MSFIKRIFTWWNGSTFGTNLQISRKGEKVGEEAYGNTYYQERGEGYDCLLYTSPSPRDGLLSRMPSSA